MANNKSKNESRAVANALLKHEFILKAIRKPLDENGKLNYTNNHCIMSESDKGTLDFVTTMLISKVTSLCKGKTNVCIAGSSFTGVLFAEKIAIYADLKFHNLITGNAFALEENSFVVIIEDIFGLNQESIHDAKRLKELGHTANDIVCIYNYDLEDINTSFQANNISVHALTNSKTLLNQALKNKFISDTEYQKTNSVFQKINIS